jgi:hypothetical protein
MAQKWNSPPVMALAVRPVPRLIEDEGGLFKFVLETPLPSWWYVSSPQHLTEPSSSKAQTAPKAVASETAVRPVPSEEMVVGVEVLDADEPMQS